MVKEIRERVIKSEFIWKIIIVIGDKLRPTSFYVAPYLVGMHSRAKNINK
ncbi:hypothetical protein LguiB_010138 [Lonicera macranthoides]